MSKRTKRSGYTHLTESDFKNIKMLQSAGLKPNQASRATKRSHNTITMVYKCSTFSEYRKLVTDTNNFQKAKREGSQTKQVSLAATETLSEVIRQAKKTGGLVITTHAAFIGFNDLYDFVREASDNEVTVTFAPMGK